MPPSRSAEKSAGGGLACAVVQFAMSNGLRTPDAMLLFSPWVDLSVPDSPVKDPTLDLEAVEGVFKALCGRHAVARSTRVTAAGTDPV